MAELVILSNGKCDLKFHQKAKDFKRVEKFNYKKNFFKILIDKNDSVYDINVSGLFFKEEFSKTIYYYSLIENKEKDFYYEKKAASTSLQKNIVFVQALFRRGTPRLYNYLCLLIKQ